MAVSNACSTCLADCTFSQAQLHGAVWSSPPIGHSSSPSSPAWQFLDRECSQDWVNTFSKQPDQLDQDIQDAKLILFSVKIF